MLYFLCDTKEKKMKKFGISSQRFILVIAIQFYCFKSIYTCPVGPVYNYELKGNIVLELYQNNSRWYNMSFWGGHVQLPWIGNLDENCPYSEHLKYHISLSEEHKNVNNIGEDILITNACIHNQTEACLMNVTVEMRTCDDFLFYRFPSTENLDMEYVSHTYICPENIYYAGCGDTTLVYTVRNVVDDLLFLFSDDIQNGWLDAHIGRQQFLYPSVTDASYVMDECVDDKTYKYGLYLQEELRINERPTKLQLCYVSNFDDEGLLLHPVCTYNIYARRCNNKIQFDVTLFEKSDRPYCLILQKSPGMSTATLIGIVIGSVSACVVMAVLVRVVSSYIRRNCQNIGAM